MFLNSLSLKHFRSFANKNFIFSPNTTLIIGPNASGKTNILEAIYLLTTGKSFRAQKETEMIKYGEEISKISGQIAPKNNLSIMLSYGKVGERKIAKKLYQVNGVGRRWRDFVGNLRSVLFRPEDIEIILGSPSIRRNYLDSVLEQIDWQYRVCNLVYQKGLRQRNKLLERIREGEGKRIQLIFWNQLLIKNGEIINQKRKEMIEFFNDFLKKILKEEKIEIFYEQSAISLARLEKYSQEEVAAGMTLVGPHRDDIEFRIQNSRQRRGSPQAAEFRIDRNLSLYGSRGEQRMALLYLKVAELEFIDQKTKERPILLLDDIFSELDKEHQREILKIVPKQQTIITSTDTYSLHQKRYDKIELV